MQVADTHNSNVATQYTDTEPQKDELIPIKHRIRARGKAVYVKHQYSLYLCSKAVDPFTFIHVMSGYPAYPA